MTTQSKANLMDFLFQQGIISISDTEMFSVKGTPLTTPIMFNYQELIQPKNLRFLADILKSELLPDATAVAGSNFGKFIAYATAETSDLQVVSIERDRQGKLKGFVESKPLKGKKVVYVNDTLTMGHNTADGLMLIDQAGGKCVEVISLFDFGFNLGHRNCKTVPTKSLITVDDIILSNDPGGIVKKWKSDNRGHFGKYNRFIEETVSV